MVMFCEHCGASIDADSKFCGECGNSLAEGLVAQRSSRAYAPRRESRKPPKKFSAILIFSIPVVFVLLIVTWFLTGTFGDRREGFEKFLPENTAFYVEVHDPIGMVADIEQSAFFKRLTASPEWKHGGISDSELKKFKDGLGRLAAVRNIVGPVGIASIPSFSETGLLAFVRIERDFIGAARLNVEQFLDSEKVKYRKNQRGGRFRYDLEAPLNSSFLLMDSGIVAGESPAILDKYIDWLETSGKSNLGISANFKKINGGKSGVSARARIYFDSSTFLNTLSKAADPAVFGSVANFPSWIAKAEVSFHDGIHLKSSASFSQSSPLSKNLLLALQKPISNGSLKYLPKDVGALSTTNLAGIWEFVREEMRRQSAGVREGDVEKLLQTLGGEALVAWLPDKQRQSSWGGGIVMGVEQKSPPAFVKVLDELLPESKEIRQTERYGAYDITCYQAVFGSGVCLVNVDNFLFASLNKQSIYQILDVKGGKAGSFQQAISANGKIDRLFAGNRHGVTYVNLKDVMRNIPLTLWGNPQELAIKETIANAPSPFYLPGQLMSAARSSTVKRYWFLIFQRSRVYLQAWRRKILRSISHG